MLRRVRNCRFIIIIIIIREKCCVNYECLQMDDVRRECIVQSQQSYWMLLRTVQTRAYNRVDVGSPSRRVRHWTCSRRPAKHKSPQPTNFNLLHRLPTSAKGLKMSTLPYCCGFKEGWLSPTGTCVSFCNQPKAHYLATSRESRQYVVVFSRSAGADIWLRQESLRHIMASRGYAPGAIAVNVTWMEREFNACLTHRSMYPSIFDRFPVIEPVNLKSSPF